MDTGRALVTGATGFIGSHLVPALVAGGWSVRACGRRARPADLDPEVDYRRADLAADDLGALFGGVTHLFHLAGASSSTSSQEEMERSNVVGTRRLLEAAAPGQLERAVHMSSTSIYGEEVQLPLPVREDTEPRPSRGYGKAKWGAEQEVWAQGRAGLAVTVLRPVSVYGPGNVKLLASAILDVAIERRAGLAAVAVHAVPLEQRLVHIDDVVNAAVHLSTHPDAAGRAYNVVGPTYPTNHEVARVIADAFAMTVELDDDPACGLGQPERVATHAAMVAGGMVPAILLTNPRFRFMGKANRNNRLSVDALLATGYHFAHGDLALGIERVIAWYRSHKWVV